MTCLRRNCAHAFNYRALANFIFLGQLLWCSPATRGHMVKVDIQELVLAIDLLRKTSPDTQVSFSEDGHSLHLTFFDADGQLITIDLYDTDSRQMAKIQKSERLVYAIKREKK
jgi:hypothetical protein